MMGMEKTEFIRCPIYGNKTRDKIREDTILKNFPLFCPKCKSESLIDIEQFHITVIKAPDGLLVHRFSLVKLFCRKGLYCCMVW